MKRMTKTTGSALVLALAAWPSLAAGQSWRDVTMSRQLGDEAEIRVDVEYGAGRLDVRSVDEGLLYRMNVRYDEERFAPVADVSRSRLRLGLESTRRGGFGLRSGGAGEMRVELARGVPMDLRLEFGAVQAEIDLGGLMLTELELRTGASESTIDVSEPNPGRMRSASFQVGAADFEALRLGNLNAERIMVDAGVGAIRLGLDGRWERDATIGIDLGVGALELIVPEGLGLRLHKSSFLTALDSEGLVKRGDVYESLDFEEADRKVVIDLDAAFGSVTVTWMRRTEATPQQAGAGSSK